MKQIIKTYLCHKLCKKNDLAQSGQTALEYMLILFAAAMVAFAVFKKLSDYLVTNPNSILNIQLEQSGMIFSKDAQRGRYRKLPYTLPKP